MSWYKSELNLEPGETLLDERGKHWWYKVQTAGLALVATLVIVGMINNLPGSLWWLIVLAILLGATGVWLFYLAQVKDRIWITDRRVIFQHQIHFLHHTRAELPHSQIQDVSSSVKGLFGTWFNFGDLQVQSAGAAQLLKMDLMADPDKLASQLRQQLTK